MKIATRRVLRRRINQARFAGHVTYWTGVLVAVLLTVAMAIGG